MLNVILMNQRAYRDKTGLGYRHKEKKWVEPKVKPYLKFFHKASSHTSSPFSFCNYCNRKGHSMSTCNAKRHGTNSTHKWVSKETKLPKDFPRQEAKEVHKPKVNHGPRARKTAPKETQTPRAQSRPKAQVTHEPKVNIGSKVPNTNERGLNKGWVPKSV